MGHLIAVWMVQIKRGFFFAAVIATSTGYLLRLSASMMQLFSPLCSALSTDLMLNTYVDLTEWYHSTSVVTIASW